MCAFRLFIYLRSNSTKTKIRQKNWIEKKNFLIFSAPWALNW